MQEKKKLTLRLSLEQYEYLKQKSQENNISMEEHLRRSMYNDNWIFLKDEITKILSEIKVEGRNLNAITKGLFTSGKVNEDSLIIIIKELNHQWQLLKQYLAEQV